MTITQVANADVFDYIQDESLYCFKFPESGSRNSVTSVQRMSVASIALAAADEDTYGFALITEETADEETTDTDEETTDTDEETTDDE